MVEVATLELTARTEGLKKAEVALDAVTKAAQRTEDAAQDAGVAAGAVGGAMAKSSGGARMLAMQLSQVGQQTMASGNFLQALAIQLPDIGLAFGAAGTAVGLLAGVALPILGNALFGTSEAVDGVATALDDMDGAIGAYIDAANAAKMTNAELTATYGELAGAARVALQAMADVALVEAMNSVDDAISRIADSILRIQVINKAGATGTFLAEDFGLAAETASNLVNAIQALENAQGLRAQAQAAAEVQRQLLAAYGSAERMPAPLRDAYGAMASIVAKSAQANTEFGKSRTLLEQMKAAADGAAGAVSRIGGAASTAYGAVSSLAAKMWEMASANAAYMEANKPGGTASLASQYAQYGAGRVAFNQGAAASGSLYNPPAVASGVAGAAGGGGGVDDFEARLAELTKGMEAERQAVDAWYAEGQALLADRRALEILGEQGHKDALIAIEEDYQQKIRAIEIEAMQNKLSQTAGLFGALADIASAGGKRSAKAVATFQAIEGTINAYGAAIKALNTPGITLPGRFAAYASVLAAGLKGVSAIRSAGGIGGSSGGESVGSAPAAAPQRDRTIRINVEGSGPLAAALRDNINVIAEALTEQTDIGGFVVT